jgi:hypothetical protein
LEEHLPYEELNYNPPQLNAHLSSLLGPAEKDLDSTLYSLQECLATLLRPLSTCMERLDALKKHTENYKPHYKDSKANSSPESLRVDALSSVVDAQILLLDAMSMVTDRRKAAVQRKASYSSGVSCEESCLFPSHELKNIVCQMMLQPQQQNRPRAYRADGTEIK